ncbi:MAG: DUF2878 domain-containing protein [Gammaproteobacteria bacterium]|nr:DUF2878 domain-containing protein [Gammaproteobacteria bacterium]
MNTIQKVINFVVFQAVWLITVMGAANGLIWPGMIAIAVALAIHAINAPQPRPDYWLAGIATGVGLIADTLLIQSGLLVFNTAIPSSAFAPIWGLILWANLGLTINHCLGWLQNRYILAALCGAVAGPIAYIGGAMLGAAQSEVSQTTLILCLGLIWALATPLLFRLSRLVDKKLQ